MPKYSNDNLNIIAASLIDAGYNGSANQVLWWNTFKKHRRDTLSHAMCMPKKELPLYINNKDSIIRTVVSTRLKIGR